MVRGVGSFASSGHAPTTCGVLRGGTWRLSDATLYYVARHSHVGLAGAKDGQAQNTR